MLGIVVVSFGSAQLLEENLAVTTAGARDLHVVVVDNHRSTDDQSAVGEVCRRHGWTFLPQPTNRGFGAGMNVGAAQAIEDGCTALVLLNPDVEASATVLRALGRDVERSPRELVSPRVLRLDGSVWFAGAVVDRRAGWTRNVTPASMDPADGWLTGACLAVSAQLWTELGGFDEDYFLYWEDVDLSRRCVGRGGSMAVRQDLTVRHEVGGTQQPSRAGKSAAYTYYNCRNRLVFAAKHLPPRERLRWVLRTPAYARQVVLRGGRRQLLRTWRPLTAAASGSFAGIGWLLRTGVTPR